MDYNYVQEKYHEKYGQVKGKGKKSKIFLTFEIISILLSILVIAFLVFWILSENNGNLTAILICGSITLLLFMTLNSVKQASILKSEPKDDDRTVFLGNLLKDYLDNDTLDYLIEKSKNKENKISDCKDIKSLRYILLGGVAPVLFAIANQALARIVEPYDVVLYGIAILIFVLVVMFFGSTLISIISESKFENERCDRCLTSDLEKLRYFRNKSIDPKSKK